MYWLATTSLSCVAHRSAERGKLVALPLTTVPVESLSIQLQGTDLQFFYSSLYSGDIAIFIPGCPQSSIEISGKCKNKNDRQTKPHPPLTLTSEDSLGALECSLDLQFLIYISHKEKFTKIS